jgi:hypothetical protein
MSKETFDFANYKEHALTRPRDEAWGNWKSWKDAVIGDKIEGYVADAFYRPEEKDEKGNVAFREQRGLTIKQVDGTLVNVGVKYFDFVLKSTDNLHVGDPIVIELTEIAQPTGKGRQGAKIFGYFGKQLPENAGNPTVKQLTDEDRKAGGSVEPVGEDVKEVEDDNSDIQELVDDASKNLE